VREQGGFGGEGKSVLLVAGGCLLMFDKSRKKNIKKRMPLLCVGKLDLAIAYECMRFGVFPPLPSFL